MNQLQHLLFIVDDTVKVVILQVGKDIMFASDLAKAAYAVGGIYAQIEDLSDISPTILKLTSTYTSLVDDNDLQVNLTDRLYLAHINTG